MLKLIECVPNFSEGVNLDTLRKIKKAIESVTESIVLNIDSGKNANRSVFTFISNTENICEAAFRAIEKASELIDMRFHKGVHPRFGATDVCPFIPLFDTTMDEAITLARKLGKRVGNELEIPVYCYENAAFKKKRINLANCRANEYEGLENKITNPLWKPDFGPFTYSKKVAKSGAVAIGARNFLVAYNINLNTKSLEIAKNIASHIRESGFPILKDGAILKDKSGNTIFQPGLLKHVKGIGWYIEEYGCTQLSFNLTDISVSSLHDVHEKACELANEKGVKVTGSELIGLIPKNPLIKAGEYYHKKLNLKHTTSEEVLIQTAIDNLGLNELRPFYPNEKIIEYALKLYTS